LCCDLFASLATLFSTSSALLVGAISLISSMVLTMLCSAVRSLVFPDYFWPDELPQQSIKRSS
ncbi:MAG: hypothetical protein AAF745_19145, partial [Planctomycetota bacterium]